MEDIPGIPLMMMIYPIPYKANIGGVADRDFIWGIDLYPLHFVDKK